MDEDWHRALGRAWHDDAPWSLLTDLTALENRMLGREGERESAERVRAAFADAGLRAPRLDAFDAQGWYRGTATLRVEPAGREFEAIALCYSPPGTVDAPLVDVGYGTPDEIDDASVDGAVALASTDTPPWKGRFVHRQESYGHALAAGAEAFVFANHVQGQLPPTGALRSGREAERPGVGVSAETGDWLREYAAEGARVHLTVDAHTEACQGHLVRADLGPDTEEAVLVLAHHDAHDVGEGALDNGSGVATLLAAVRLLAAVEDDLERRLHVVATSGEEVGLLGARALVDRLDLDRIHVVANLDGVGRFRDLIAYVHDSESIADLVARVCEDVSHPVQVDAGPHPHSDHWPFLREGVPCLQLHSQSGERGRGFTHTRADTRDKADRRAIRDHGMLAALLLRALAASDVPRLDAAALADAFRDANYERGMRAMGNWPEDWD